MFKREDINANQDPNQAIRPAHLELGARMARHAAQLRPLYIEIPEALQLVPEELPAPNRALDLAGIEQLFVEANNEINAGINAANNRRFSDNLDSPNNLNSPRSEEPMDTSLSTLSPLSSISPLSSSYSPFFSPSRSSTPLSGCSYESVPPSPDVVSASPGKTL